MKFFRGTPKKVVQKFRQKFGSLVFEILDPLVGAIANFTCLSGDEWSFYGAACATLVYAFLSERFVHPQRQPHRRVAVAYPRQPVVLDL